MKKLGSLLILLLTGISAALSSTHLAAQELIHKTAEPFKVGVAIPLTGDFGKFGVDVQRGMILAQEELHKEAIDIKLIFEDTQYQPRLAVTAAQKLLTTDRVNVLVSLWDTAEAVAPLAERARIPHFSLRWNPQVAMQFAHTFTFESTYITWVKEVIGFLRSENAKRVSLLTDRSGSAWVMARESFLEQAAQSGLSVINDVQFSGSQDDLKTSITKLLANSGDYIVMLHYEPTLSEVMRRLQSLRVTTPITGFFEGMEEHTNFEGRRFVSQFHMQPWFSAKFTSRFPNEKPIKAAFGYDLVSILGKLMRDKGRAANTEEILAHLNSLQSYHGATGTISANSTRNIETRCVKKVILKGAAVLLGSMP